MYKVEQIDENTLKLTKLNISRDEYDKKVLENGDILLVRKNIIYLNGYDEYNNIRTQYNLNNSTSYLLSEKLYELNGKLKQNPPTKKVSENALEKSTKTGCFIFLLRKEKLQELI